MAWFWANFPKKPNNFPTAEALICHLNRPIFCCY
jgi:hypothetical protein